MDLLISCIRLVFALIAAIMCIIGLAHLNNPEIGYEALAASAAFSLVAIAFKDAQN